MMALAREDPQRTVPQYPSWSLLDLLSHTGAVMGRTAIVCRERLQERVSAPRPGDEDDVLEWFESQLTDMIEILGATDAGTPVWGFGPSPNVGAWFDRMLIEVGVHRWDAEQAFDRPIPLLDEVAVAGLDEFSQMWHPRLGPVSTVAIEATDLGRVWQFGPGDPMHSLEGSGSDIYLRLMSRPSPVKLPPDWAAAVDALEPPPR
jgi:uncharacterized protein (TIGR03083 family)